MAHLLLVARRLLAPLEQVEPVVVDVDRDGAPESAAQRAARLTRGEVEDLQLPPPPEVHDEHLHRTGQPAG